MLKSGILHKIYVCFSFTVVGLLLSACVSQSVEIVQVEKSHEFNEKTETQDFPIFNCQNQDEILVPVERTRTLQQSIKLNLNGIVTGGLLIHLPITDLQFRVGAEYGWNSNETSVDSNGLVLKVSPGKYPIYKILWRETWENGYVVINNVGQETRVPYQYLVNVQPEIQGPVYLDCNKNGYATATKVATPLLKETPTPPAVPTLQPIKVGDSYNGTISKSESHDYKFISAKKNLVKVVAKSLDFDIVIEIYNADAKRIITVDHIYWGGLLQGGPDEEEVTFAPGMGNEYTIRIRGSDSLRGYDSGSYVIHIEEGE